MFFVLYRNALLSITLIAIAVALLYGHTLHVPFYLDDQWAIVDKYLLRDLPATLSRVFSQRGLNNLTFALNYRFTGLSLPALHLTNIVLHAGCALLVWRLLLRLIGNTRLALLGALLFVAHPLQTQAVTYLVQRSAVLGTLFFLLAFLFHLRAREALTAGASRRDLSFLLPWCGALVAGACAVLAKENTATLVVVLFAYDRLFPLPVLCSFRQQCSYYLPFAVIPLLLGGVMLVGVESTSPGFPLASLEGSTPLTYLLTEFSVLWVYLRLLVLPYGQALEHDFPVVTQIMTLQNVISLSGFLILSYLLWRVRRVRPLLAFGGAWFFLALLVESSIIPLDPLFEHRLYLPMFGFVLVVLDGGTALLGSRRAGIAIGIALLVCFPLTWQRNALWNKPISLYEDNLRQVPGSERASETLAVFYARAGRYDDELQQLKKILQTHPRNYIVYINMAKAFAEEQRLTEAFALLEVGIRQLPTNYKLYETAAELAQFNGDSQRALSYLQRGLKVEGIDRAILLNDLGVFYAASDENFLAEQAFRGSLKENPAYPATWLSLGKEYYAQRRWTEALDVFRQALRLDPGNPEILEGLGHSALALGDVVTARWAAGKLRYADRMAGQRLHSAIVLSFQGSKP